MQRSVQPRKKVIWLLAIVLLVVCILSVNSIFRRNNRVVLHQAREAIVNIELGYSPWRENRIIYSLEKDEFDVFLDALDKLKCYKNSSPRGEHGSLYIQITYIDDSIEILGSSSFRYMSPQIEDHDGWHYLLEEDLYALFSQYLDLTPFSF